MGTSGTRTVLVHLNVKVPPEDQREPDEIASFLLHILKATHGLGDLDVSAPLAEEVYTTATGKQLADSDIEALADEAEKGYDVEHLKQ